MEEYCDMLLVYGKSDQNAHEAMRRYVEKYPNRRRPNQNVFLRLINRVRTSGYVIPMRKNFVGRHFSVRNVENEEEVLRTVEENSSASVRQMSRQFEMSKTTIHRILQENQMHFITRRYNISRLCTKNKFL